MFTDERQGRQTGRQTDRQTDRQADRQADRQTGRQTDRQTVAFRNFANAAIKIRAMTVDSNGSFC